MSRWFPATKRDSQRIAIFAPSRNAPSETFIRNHIARLPFVVIPRHGQEFEITNALGSSIWPMGGLLGRLLGKVSPKLRRFVRDQLLSWHLRRLSLSAVMAEFGVTGCWLDRACKKADIPLIVHFHGYDASVSSVLKTHEDDYVRLFGSASAIIAVSRSMKQRLIELGAPMHKVHVSPCGVDQSSFLPCRPADQPPHFLAVGRFVEKKAPYLTILSFSLVAKENPEVVLVMIGDGPLLGPCKRLVQALGLSDRVHLLGSRGPHDVISYLQSSRAFLQHSLEAENGDCEGTPVAVVEAQMSGIPVIATRHAGIPDVVVDGTTGFLVEEADVQGMAAAIKRLAQNPQLAGEMGTLARKRALENFSLDQHISQLATVIQAAIDR